MEPTQYVARPEYRSDFKALDTRIRKLETSVARIIGWAAAAAAGGSAAATTVLDLLR